MITDTAFMIYFNENVPVTPEILERAGTRHAWAWFKTAHETLADLSDLLGPNDYSLFDGYAAAAKAANPNVKVGIYVGGIASPDSHHPHFDWVADADQLHQLDGDPVQLVPAMSPAEPGARRVKVINYGRAVTRAKMIDNWIAFLESHGYDGVVFDTFNEDYYAAWLANDLGCPTGALEGAVHTRLWWAQYLSTFVSEMKAAFASYGLEVWVNGLDEPGAAYDMADPADLVMGQESTKLSTYANGVLAEYVHRIYLGGSYLTNFLAMAGRVEALGGRAFYLFMPWSFIFSDPGYTWPNNAETHRYYLAAYLLIHRPGATYFGYHPEINYQGYTVPPHEPYLFDGGEDWDQSIGAPVGSYGINTQAGGTVYYREYEQAFVLLNPGTSKGRFSTAGTYHVWNPDTGTEMVVSPDSPAVVVPPRSGLVLFKIASTLEWRLKMRARLQHVAMDTAGNVQTNKAVTVYDVDGVSAFGQTMYDAPSGGAVVTNPQTDSLGLLKLYAPLGARVKLAVDGVAGQYDSEFEPDPEELLQRADAISLDRAAGDTDPMLYIQPQTGGSGGNKSLVIENADGTLALEVVPHATLSPTAGLPRVPSLLIDNDNGSPRVYADMSDGAPANRLMFQTSVENGPSNLGILPNGTSMNAALTVFGRSDPLVSEVIRMRATAGTNGAVLESLGVGLSAPDILMQPAGAEAFRFAANGDVRMPDAGVATNASAGFFYVVACNGAPTGSPAIGTNIVPMVVDRANSRLYIRIVNTWKYVALT